MVLVSTNTISGINTGTLFLLAYIKTWGVSLKILLFP